MNSRRSSVLGAFHISVLIAFALPRTATADTILFTLSSTGISAAGTFITGPLSGGNFLITGLTGTLNGQSLSLLPVDTYPRNNDNLLYAATPFADTFGIAFAAGGTDYLLFYDTQDEPTAPPALAICSAGPGNCGAPVLGAGDVSENGNPGVATLQFTDVAEPATLLMLGFGLIALGAIKHKVKVAVPAR